MRTAGPPPDPDAVAARMRRVVARPLEGPVTGSPAAPAVGPAAPRPQAGRHQRTGLRREPDGHDRAVRAGPRSAGSARAALTDLLPVTLRSAVVAVPAPAALGLVLLVGIAVAAVVLLWAAARPEVSAVPPRAVPAASGGAAPAESGTVGAAAAPTGAATGAAPLTSVLVVDVAGHVRRPGVVRLRTGDRVVDALEAAGGATRRADLRLLNLARPLTDGEQVLVLAAGEQPPPVLAAGGDGGPASGAATGAAGEGQLDLNTASAEDFDGLPGVGPVLAERIVEWRTQHGRFSSVQELQEVNGIGAARFAELETLVRV